MLSNAMGPLYQNEFEVANNLAGMFENAAESITEVNSGDYDFKILKELRSDYEDNGETEYTEETRQEQSILGTVTLLPY